MSITHIIGGLRALTHDITTPICAALLAVPPLLDDRLPAWAAYATLGWLTWNGVLYVQNHHDIAERIERGEWDPRWAQHDINRLNVHTYVKAHPEHRDAYERLRRSLGGE